MDGGFLEPGETMDDEYDYSMDLLPEEVMGIIDQLLLHEVSLVRCSLNFLADRTRLHGIWATHCHKQSSPACMLTEY